jgi:hypothetical protein
MPLLHVSEGKPERISLSLQRARRRAWQHSAMALTNDLEVVVLPLGDAITDGAALRGT